jgi:hypothetical protein
MSLTAVFQQSVPLDAFMQYTLVAVGVSVESSKRVKKVLLYAA